MTDHRSSVTFDRREVVARLLRDRRDLIAVSSLGSATYDVAAAGDHDRNFYLWGAMGGAIPLALGLALAQPEIPIAVFVGDGEALMGMGSFATVALQRPANLSVVILDNGSYGETGGQLSHTASCVDLAGIARACGIPNSLVVANDAEIESLAGNINTVGDGPIVAVVKIDAAQKPRCLPSRDGVLLKTRLRSALRLEPM